MKQPPRRLHTPAERSNAAGPLTALVRGEEGIVMVVSMIVLFVVLLVAASVLTQAVQVSSKSNRDPLEAAAVQAADSGIETALYRLNALAAYTTDTSSSTPCPVATVDANGNVQNLQLQAATTLAGVSWCWPSPQLPDATSTWQALGNRADFSYQMTPMVTSAQQGFSSAREIMATGRATNANRTVYARVREMADTVSLPGGGGGGGLEAVKKLTVTGTAIVGSSSDPIPLYSNGTVEIDSNATQCGQLYYYVSETDSSTKCTNPSPTQLSSPLYVPSASLLQFTSGMVCSTLNSCDSYFAQTVCASHCTITGSGETMTVNITNQATVTVPPGVYAMCGFSIDNGASFTISSTASGTNPVIFYIEPPSVCGASEGGFTIDGGSLTSTTGPNSFVVEVAGPASPATGAVNINGNGTSSNLPLTIIAPNSTVTINGTSNTTVNDAYILGNTITLSGTGQFDVSGPVGEQGSGGSLFWYEPAVYTECSAALPASTSAPDQGC